ncbi:MAG TPA: S9 family peptidase [Steroidobacteraceae bacterium]|nr:S9 family peptidase [Steroidobacteraceae bacterium]
MRLKLLSPLLLLIVCLGPPAALAGRAIEPEDWYRFQALSDLQIAPDGASVAYLVTSYDKEADESRSALWSAEWAHGEGRPLTHGESVWEPRFSPDGRYLSFLAARPEDSGTQLWLLDRRGGEARAVSHVSGEISSYEWSPDGAHVVLVMSAEAEGGGKAKGAAKTVKPLVIDAFQFKQDKRGYLTAGMRTHLYLLDVRSGECAALTAESMREDSAPAFSPDGRQIAFVGTAIGTARDVGRDDIYIVAASAGAPAVKLLSTFSPNHQKLAWSPDGRQLAFLQGDAPKFNAYITDVLAVADVGTGKVRALTAGLDRAVLATSFSADGRSLLFAVEDDGYQYPAAVELASGVVTPLAREVVVHELVAAQGHTAVLVSSDHAPPEVYALEQGKLRPLSAHNQALFAELSLGSVTDIRFTSRGGTEVHGQIVKPPDYVPARRYPTILWIHGGPNGQDDHSLELWGYGPPLERQLFATHGYVVLAVNYRGGTGRGAAYARTIGADWGHKEVEDLLAGVDYAVSQGIADPQRLGIGGWSYGGILTDYTIASDTRFKAAISGAGSGNQTGMYGADEYVVQYNAELGPPWQDTALWLKVSYPFFHADRIRTPTLFLGGTQDFNVPLAGGEQMYQALRTLGVPAQLIVYPGQFHSLTRPSFLVDRSQRYLEWMDRYLKAAR